MATFGSLGEVTLSDDLRVAARRLVTRLHSDDPDAAETILAALGLVTVERPEPPRPAPASRAGTPWTTGELALLDSDLPSSKIGARIGHSYDAVARKRKHRQESKR